MKSESDRRRVDETSEKDMLEQIIADPDLVSLTDEELAQMRIASERPRTKRSTSSILPHHSSTCHLPRLTHQAHTEYFSCRLVFPEPRVA